MPANWNVRPRHAPREITSGWPGITYPSAEGLQVRVSLNGKRYSRYYSYSSFDGDAAAAHRAAAKWRMDILAGRKFKLRGKGPYEHKQQRRIDGVVELAIVCRAQRPDGRRTQVKFFIGTENTVTKERRRRAMLRAEMWWGQYRRWYEDGGRHPMDKPSAEFGR
jgi:hypothetical protein